MVHTALAGKTNASKANAASALQRLLSAAREIRIIANNAHCFNLEREAAAAAALDMAAAWRGQLLRTLGLGAAREADGRRRRASEYRRANDARTTHGAGAGRGVEELDAEEKGGGGGDCRLHCANMSCCWRKQQLHARVCDDE